MNKETRIIEMYNKGISYIEIQKELKICYNTICKVLKQNGLPTRRSKLSWDLDKAIDLFKQGYSTWYIGKYFKVSDSTISEKLKSLGYDTRNPKSVAKFNENIFDNIDTEEKAYWLGFIFADGNISQSKRKSGRSSYDFELSLAIKDINHLYKFNKFMQYNGCNIKTDSYRCRWIIGNKHLWETLNNYGCVPNKSLILKFPDKLPVSFISVFIRGYFDGDGSISTKETSKTTLQISLIGTKEVLSKICLHSNISTNIKNPKGYNPNTWVFTLSVFKSEIFLKYIYDNSTIYLDRKYNLWKNYCRSLEESNDYYRDISGKAEMLIPR